MDMIRKGMWKDKSGRLVNPEKMFFKLSTKYIRDVNHEYDEHGLQDTRNAMILTAMPKIINRLWEVTQLTPEVQASVKKNHSFFDAAQTSSINQQ